MTSHYITLQISAKNGIFRQDKRHSSTISTPDARIEPISDYNIPCKIADHIHYKNSANEEWHVPIRYSIYPNLPSICGSCSMCNFRRLPGTIYLFLARWLLFPIPKYILYAFAVSCANPAPSPNHPTPSIVQNGKHIATNLFISHLRVAV